MSSTGNVRGVPASVRSRKQAEAQSAPRLTVVALALGTVSAATLAFEILLTRLFSLVFQYHFAFLAVSIATLGLGLGGFLAFILGTTRDKTRASIWMIRAVLFFALVLLLATLVFSQAVSAGLSIFLILFSLLPFCTAGLFSATVYTLHSQQSARLYAVDLLGAVIGLAFAQFLINPLGAFNATFLAGGLVSLSALLFQVPTRQRTFSLAIASSAGLLMVANLGFGLFNLPLNIQNAPPDKVMYHVLADPSQQAQVIDTAWSPFARIDLVRTNDPAQMYIFTDAGAGSFMIHYDGDPSQVAWLKDQVGYLPFVQGSSEKTLILGSGAGKDILQALLAGSHDITAVEINPAMVTMTRHYASYNGDIYDRPGVHAVVADGRTFIERSNTAYDLIYLNLVYSQASEPTGAALSESYIFTEEALQAYWRHLTPGGRLAIVSHQALEGSRVLLTAVSALESEGFKPSDVLKRSALVMYPDDDPNQRLSVMVLRKQPWTQAEIADFTQASLDRGLQALYVPGVFEITMRGLTNDAITVQEFVSGEEYNLLPTRDDQPFFFNLTPGLPAILRTLLWVILLVCAIYLGVLLVSRLFSARAKISMPSLWQVLYFGLIGAGFMLVEVPLIQRFILLLGGPTQAFVLVLGALLLGAGLGSVLSGRIAVQNILTWVALSGVLVGVSAFLAAFFQAGLVQALLPASLMVRVVTTGLALILLGLPLGIPFASGLRLSGMSSSTNLSLLWGWNALTGVLGSVTAAILAMSFGFKWVLLAGTSCYLALALLASVLHWLSIHQKISGLFARS